MHRIRNQIANIRWIIEKAREFQKNIYFCFIDYAKAFDCVKVKVKSLSHVLLFATPWTAAYQTPPSMGSSRQEYWSGVLFPSPGYVESNSSSFPKTVFKPQFIKIYFLSIPLKLSPYLLDDFSHSSFLTEDFM